MRSEMSDWPLRPAAAAPRLRAGTRCVSMASLVNSEMVMFRQAVSCLRRASRSGGSFTVARMGQASCCYLASEMLAFRNMKTLYLRNVPEEVVRRLETLAGREGMSVSAMAVRELARSTRRADNPALLGDLPGLGVESAEILNALHEGRAE